MSAYEDTDQLQITMMELWNAIKNDASMSGKLLSSRLIVQFQYRDPIGRITIDCSDGIQFLISCGETNAKPQVEMAMKADVAHNFWLGKVNVPVAILTGQMMARGPVNTALALLPVLKPAYAMYPEIYERCNPVGSSVTG
jgi:hypothetical protein